MQQSFFCLKKDLFLTVESIRFFGGKRVVVFFGHVLKIGEIFIKP